MQPPPLCLVFEETNDPNSRSFFSEIISSISDVKFSHSGRYLMTRDYLSVKIWDLNMENRPLETYQVRGKDGGKRRFAPDFERCRASPQGGRVGR